jgi:hypothetical protein
MLMRWPRRQHGPPSSPGPATLIAVAVVAFGSAFGVARAAGGGEPSAAPAGAEPRPVALQTASALPAMNAPPGPSEAELAAQRAKRERRLEKRKAAKEEAAREERQRLRAERRAQRVAEREAEAEAKRQAAAERKRNARERERQQEENTAPEQPEQTTPEPPPPTSTTPVGEPFDDSG